MDFKGAGGTGIDAIQEPGGTEADSFCGTTLWKQRDLALLLKTNNFSGLFLFYLIGLVLINKYPDNSSNTPYPSPELHVIRRESHWVQRLSGPTQRACLKSTEQKFSLAMSSLLRERPRLFQMISFSYSQASKGEPCSHACGGVVNTGRRAQH